MDKKYAVRSFLYKGGKEKERGGELYLYINEKGDWGKKNFFIGEFLREGCGDIWGNNLRGGKYQIGKIVKLGKL